MKVLVNSSPSAMLHRVIDNANRVVGMARLHGDRVKAVTPCQTQAFVCRKADGSYEERTIIGRRSVRIPIEISKWMTVTE